MRKLLYACAVLFFAGSLSSCCCRHAPEIADLFSDDPEVEVTG